MAKLRLRALNGLDQSHTWWSWDWRPVHLTPDLVLLNCVWQLDMNCLALMNDSCLKPYKNIGSLYGSVLSPFLLFSLYTAARGWPQSFPWNQSHVCDSELPTLASGCLLTPSPDCPVEAVMQHVHSCLPHGLPKTSSSHIFPVLVTWHAHPTSSPVRNLKINF